MKQLLQYWGAFRVAEVLGKLGFVLIGALFAIRKIDMPTFLTLGKIGCYSFVNGLAIFCYNAWTGFEADKYNQRLQKIIEVKKGHMLLASLFLFFISLFIIFIHRIDIAGTALAVWTGWFLYSWPEVNLKGIPLGGLVVSFATEILLFHLSYLFFMPYSYQSVSISLYFALLVSAGHLIHELIDQKADQEQNIRTTAVWLGQSKTTGVIKLIYLVAFLHLFAIFFVGYVSMSCALCLGLAQLGSGLTYWKIQPHNSQGFIKLRNLYMTYYILGIILYVGIALM
jgi:1,4-dihydroxy-2-naphthoate octaprenyltransferase